MVGVLAAATPFAAGAFSIRQGGGAAGTVDLKIHSVKAYNPSTGQPAIGMDPATGAADNLVLACHFNVLVPPGHTAAQLYYDKTGSNELWVDGKLETTWLETVKSNPQAQSTNHVLRTKTYTYVSPTKFAPGTHVVKCRLNANGGIPESAAHKGNNEGSATFTVVKVLKAQPKWPGH
jgi:hypothetical protein